MTFLEKYFFSQSRINTAKESGIMLYFYMCSTPTPFTITYLADVSNEEFVIAVRACVANHKATTTWSNGAWKKRKNTLKQNSHFHKAINHVVVVNDSHSFYNCA